jgi:hypothetical protein
MTTVRGLDRAGDDDLLQALLETDPAYAERVTGYPPGPSDGYSTLTVVPPDFDPGDVGTLRLAVVDTNTAVATPFWESLGYRPTGEVKPWVYDKLESTTRLYERPVQAGPGA